MNDPVLQMVGDLVADIESDLEESRSLVTNAVVVAAFIDPEDGARWLRIIRDGDTRQWEIRGMLAEVLSDLDAFDVVDALTEED